MSVNWWQTPWTERSLCPALYTRCFHLSCDALRSRAAIISISQVRETEASGSEPQPQAPSGTLVDPLVTPEGFREPGSWMELAHPLCAPPPDMSEGRGRGLRDTLLLVVGEGGRQVTSLPEPRPATSPEGTGLLREQQAAPSWAPGGGGSAGVHLA